MESGIVGNQGTSDGRIVAFDELGG